MKRYDFDQDAQNSPLSAAFMREDENGDWVKFEDVDGSLAALRFAHAELTWLTPDNPLRIAIEDALGIPHGIAPNTRWVHPPIPFRGRDWCAWWGDEDEGTVYGWGATESEAIYDLNISREPLRYKGNCTQGAPNPTGEV